VIILEIIFGGGEDYGGLVMKFAMMC